LPCLESLPGLGEEIGYRAEPGDFIIGEALPCRRSNRKCTKQAAVRRLERVAGIGGGTEFAHKATVRVAHDALFVGHKRLEACSSGSAILLTEFERLGCLQVLRRYAVHKCQPEAPARRIDAIVGAHNRAEVRLDVLERHAAEFARFGRADQVGRDLKQHGLPLQRLLSPLALADIKRHSLVFV
jgi:hypothetical protein